MAVNVAEKHSKMIIKTKGLGPRQKATTTKTADTTQQQPTPEFRLQNQRIKEVEML
jgi:hypothetical protein